MFSSEEKSYLDSVLHVMGAEFDCDDCDNDDDVSDDVGVERDLIRDGETDDDDDDDEDDEERFSVILDFFIVSTPQTLPSVVASSHVTSSLS